MILCQRTSEFTPENYYGLLEEMKAHLHKHQGAVSLVFFAGRLRIWTNIGSTRDSWQYTWYHLQIRLLYLPYYGILAHFSKWFCSLLKMSWTLLLDVSYLKDFIGFTKKTYRSYVNPKPWALKGTPNSSGSSWCQCHGIIPVDFMAAPECNEVDEREAYVEKKDAGDTCWGCIQLKGVFFKNLWIWSCGE